MAKVKINNPKTKKSCAIRQRSTKKGRKGQIMGLYQIKKEAAFYVKRNFGDVIKKLSNQ